MKTNNVILDVCSRDGETSASYSSGNIYKAMKEARIDTLQHLLKQFEVNSKKLNGKSAIVMVQELINEIQKT